jgi:hypothetical protein
LYIEERGGLVWADVHVGGETSANSVPAWDVKVSMMGYKTAFALAKDNHRVLSGRVEYPNGAVVEMVGK